jgi:UrcA family protein
MKKSLIWAMTACASVAQAAPHIVYTHHVRQVDTHGLDLTRAADVRVLETRVAQAAEQVCGGRPSRSNRYYDESELKLLLPAYEKCRTEAIQRASASIRALAQTLAGNERP